MAPVDGSRGLSAGAWLDLDLLRQRRDRFGLDRPRVVPVRDLLWRGGLIGAVVPFLLLLVILFLVVQERQLTQRQRRFEPIAAEHDAEALAICTVSDDIPSGEALSSEERQTTFDEMIVVALETVIA